MTSETSPFEQLSELMAAGGVADCIARLVEVLAEQKKHQELFEARKMQVRHELGLPLLSNELPADLDDNERHPLEDQLIDRYRVVYRDVGLLMFHNQELEQGWMLLHAAGEEEMARKELESMQIDDEQLDDFIEVTLHQGVAPALGFSAVLDNYGTCNAITIYDQSMYGHPLPERQATAGLLVAHVHEDLLATLKADIFQQKGSEPEESTLRELIADRAWLFNDGAYHIDTTHLASVVRIARCLEDESQLRTALDLTEYGRRLDKPHQQEGDEPFRDLYRSHALFFHAMLGEQVDEAVDYFRQRAEEIDIEEMGSTAAETYIALLDCLGQPGAAAEATIRLIPADVPRQGLAPSLFELCDKQGEFAPLIDACRQRDDLLGFAAGLIQSHLQEK